MGQALQPAQSPHLRAAHTTRNPQAELRDEEERTPLTPLLSPPPRPVQLLVIPPGHMPHAPVHAVSPHASTARSRLDRPCTHQAAAEHDTISPIMPDAVRAVTELRLQIRMHDPLRETQGPYAAAAGSR